MTQTDNLNLILDTFKNNKPVQSLLFIGPEGSLKFFTIKELAKSINCLNSEFNACNSCESCKKIEAAGHSDFHIYGTSEDHIKISDIHDLQKSINMRPYEASKKIYVIKDAHNLTNDAANCLLKTLEEPPKDSLIILTTSKASKILPTIMSRCQKFYFSVENMHEFAIASKEKNFVEFKNKIIDLIFKDKVLTKGFSGLEQRQEFKLALMISLSLIRDLLFIKLDAPKDDLINLDRLSLLLEIKDDFEILGLLNIFDEILKLSLNIEQNANLKLIFDVLILKIDENRLPTRGITK